VTRALLEGSEAIARSALAAGWVGALPKSGSANRSGIALVARPRSVMPSTSAVAALASVIAFLRSIEHHTASISPFHEILCGEHTETANNCHDEEHGQPQKGAKNGGTCGISWRDVLAGYLSYSLVHGLVSLSL